MGPSVGAWAQLQVWSGSSARPSAGPRRRPGYSSAVPASAQPGTAAKLAGWGQTERNKALAWTELNGTEFLDPGPFPGLGEDKVGLLSQRDRKR